MSIARVVGDVISIARQLCRAVAPVRVALVVLAVAALAVTPPASAQQMHCTRTDSPGVSRASSALELISDITLSCTGGTPTATGNRVPEWQVLVTANVPLLSKTLPVTNPSDWGRTEALLLLDEPQPDAQKACVATSGFDSCPLFAGDPAANVFQARQIQDNAVVFQSVPVDAPGDGATRTLRITNLRANPSAIPDGTGVPSITTAVLIYDWSGRSIPVDGPERTSSVALPAFRFAVRTADDQPVATGEPAYLATPSMVSKTNPDASKGFLVRFSEAFSTAFKRRNIGTSPEDPSFVVSQNQTGAAWRTESGFFNDEFPEDNGLNIVGLADTGTRLTVQFSGIPAGVQVWVSTREVSQGTTNYSTDTPKALLTYTTNSSGDGPFSLVNDWVPGYAQLYVDNGSTTATWEIVSTDPNAVEDLTFSIALTAQGGNLHTGAAKLVAGLAPFSAMRADGSLPVPSFVAPDGDTDAIPAFSVVNTIPGKKAILTSAATMTSGGVAPGSLVTATLPGYALFPAYANGSTLPSTLGGVSLNVTDFTGAVTQAGISKVNGEQVTFLLDPSVRTGLGVVRITANGKPAGTGSMNVVALSPGLFTADGSGTGVAAGVWTAGTGNQSITQPLAIQDPLTGEWKANPVDLLSSSQDVYLVLNGTGFRSRSKTGYVRLEIGGVAVPILDAGANPDIPGQELIKAGPLPKTLADRGLADVQFTVDKTPANHVSIEFGSQPAPPSGRSPRRTNLQLR